MILLNAAWIGIDIEFNKAAPWLTALVRGRGQFDKGLTKGFQNMSKTACAVSLDRNMYTCTRTFVHECYCTIGYRDIDINYISYRR